MNRHTNKLTSHKQDMIVALRDVAGFMWGGSEMSTLENGDFMHFDLRNTDYGKTVMAAARDQHEATDATLDKKKAEADAKKAKDDAATAAAAAAKQAAGG